MRQFTKKAVKNFLRLNFGIWLAEGFAAFVMISVCLWPPPEFTATHRILLAVLILVLIVSGIVFSIRSYSTELSYFQRYDKEYCHEHERFCPDAYEDILRNSVKFYNREDFLQCPECKKVLINLFNKVDKIMSEISSEPSK